MEDICFTIVECLQRYEIRYTYTHVLLLVLFYNFMYTVNIIYIFLILYNCLISN